LANIGSSPVTSLERFEAYAARKIRQAERAVLPPYRTSEVGATADLIAIGNAWTTELFDGPFYVSPPRAQEGRPACSLVFVQSRDGNTGAGDPSSLGGGETDKQLVYEGLSRVAADAVLAGAGTARGDIVFSVWHPELVALRGSLGLPRHPVQIIATTRGLDIDRQLLLNLPHVPAVVLTLESGAALMRDGLAARPWITPVVMARPDDLPAAFERLGALGIGRISAVGGRTLATQLIDARLVQDVYLTTSPRAGGEPDTPMYPRPLQTSLVLRKGGSGVETGVVFEHLRL
jgi:riboflavin biosynthesis pyrimidine reductase